MGREATGSVRTADGKGSAKVLLETDELIFRGEVRAKVPFRSLTTVQPGPDGLRLLWPEGEPTVDLPEAEAARWADKIQNNAGLVDVKVARFSGTHSALKLVIPKARR